VGRCYGEKIASCKSAKKTEVSGKRIQSMCIVRSSESFLTKVWYVPNMFPGKSFTWRNSGSHQVQLVDGWFKFRSLVLL
jgi:hypothetical protein